MPRTYDSTCEQLVGALSPQGGGGMAANVAVAARTNAMRRAAGTRNREKWCPQATQHDADTDQAWDNVLSTCRRRSGTGEVAPHALVAAPSGTIVVSGLNTIVSPTHKSASVSQRSPTAHGAHDVALRGANTPIIAKNGGGVSRGGWTGWLDGVLLGIRYQVGGRARHLYPPPRRAQLPRLQEFPRKMARDAQRITFLGSGVPHPGCAKWMSGSSILLGAAHGQLKLSAKLDFPARQWYNNAALRPV